jgi:PAS domain S-box-containing protein
LQTSKPGPAAADLAAETARDVAELRALEAQASENAMLFETAFEYAAIGKALVGLDGKFLRINEAFCRIVGLPAAVMLNLDFQSITHPDDLDADLSLLARLTAGEIESYRLDKRYLHAEGHVVWVRLAVSMVRNADGTPKHYVAQVQDQTQQREAEAALTESEARYRLIAENTSDMIVMSDLTGRIQFVSRAVERAGWKPEDLVGAHSAETMHPDDAKEVTRVFGQLLRGEPARRVRWRGRDGASGEWLWWESSPTLLTDPETGEPTGFLDVVRDVGLQVEQEAALAQARAEAEAAVAVKSQFLANMSHEIRTPLTAVVGFTSLLKEDPSLSGVAAGYVDRIAAAGNALLAIVNDVLDFSRLEAGKIEIRARPTDVVEVCRETLGVFATQAEAKGLSLQFAADPGLLRRVSMIDSERLRQMLVNLIGNAIKFTETGAVSLAVVPGQLPDTVEIEVNDTGPGLDSEAPGAAVPAVHPDRRFDDAPPRRHGPGPGDLPGPGPRHGRDDRRRQPGGRGFDLPPDAADPEGRPARDRRGAGRDAGDRRGAGVRRRRQRREPRTGAQGAGGGRRGGHRGRLRTGGAGAPGHLPGRRGADGPAHARHGRPQDAGAHAQGRRSQPGHPGAGLHRRRRHRRRGRPRRLRRRGQEAHRPAQHVRRHRPRHPVDGLRTGGSHPCR